MALVKVKQDVISDTVNLGRRNLIINGDMRVAQRGTSASVSDGSNEGYSTVDRFNFQITGLTGVAYTASQSTDAPDNFPNSFKLDCTTAASLAATTNTRFYQRIEGQNLQHLGYGTSGAKSLTASFWVKSNKTGSYGLWFYNVGVTRGISRLYTIDSADTWEYKTVTISGDTSGSITNDSSYGLEMRFAIAVGSDLTSGTLATNWGSLVNADRHAGHDANIGLSTDDYWQITGIQLEVGDTATPFEHRPFGDELIQCQRYYQKSYPYTNYAGDNLGSGAHGFIPINSLDDVNIHFTQIMRATPTLTTYRKNGTATSSAQRADNGAAYLPITVSEVRDNGFHFNPDSSVSRRYRLHYIADAEL
jgi:hypothetical protein